MLYERNIAIDFNFFLRCASRTRAKLPRKIKRARFPSHDFVRLLLEATSGFFFSSLFIRHFNSPSSVNWLLKSFATQVNSSKRLSESRAWLLLAFFSLFSIKINSHHQHHHIAPHSSSRTCRRGWNRYVSRYTHSIWMEFSCELRRLLKIWFHLLFMLVRDPTPRSSTTQFSMIVNFWCFSMLFDGNVHISRIRVFIYGREMGEGRAWCGECEKRTLISDFPS